VKFESRGYPAFCAFSEKILTENVMDNIVTDLLIAEALMALVLLWRGGVLKTSNQLIFAVILTGGAFLIRWIVFPYETLDYQNFLTHWVDFFCQHGGFAALKSNVGNYNVPYLYFMALFSYSDIKDLYLIKLLTVFFDVILAYSAMQLLGLYRSSPERKMACFFAVLYWPTVFLNGALWGQCDSIYVAFAVLSIYLALDDRPVLSMVAIALSFGFKLQAVFVMPVFAVLWMMKKFKWYHFLIFPLTYVALVMPAVLTGRPFLDTVTLYLSQTGSIGDGLNYNSSSIFAVFYNYADKASAARIFILIAFCFVIAVLFRCLISREKLNREAVLAAAVLLAVGIPFLLPHMHDRYFFAADILTLVLAFTAFEFAPVAILTEFASFLGYYAYLEMRFLLPMQYGALALVIVMLAAVFYFEKSLRYQGFLKSLT